MPSYGAVRKISYTFLTTTPRGYPVGEIIIVSLARDKIILAK